MAKRLLSHLLIMLAVFVLTATFFIWTIEQRVLNSEVLSAELQKAGVTQELANILPDIATQEEGENTDQSASNAEEAELKASISEVITADYVHQKVQDISSSVLSYVKGQSDTATIDISDFPQRLTAAGIETGDDINEKFSEPINLNENGQLDSVAQAYSIFSALKFVGIALFILLILAEWFVAERGKKLQRISRIFLYSGAWYVLYWLLLIVVPSRLSPTLKRQTSDGTGDINFTGLIDTIIKAVQGLFSGYFLSFAIVCLVIAFILYIIRHFKHGDVVTSDIYATPTKPIRNK